MFWRARRRPWAPVGSAWMGGEIWGMRKGWYVDGWAIFVTSSRWPMLLLVVAIKMGDFLVGGVCLALAMLWEIHHFSVYVD